MKKDNEVILNTVSISIIPSLMSMGVGVYLQNVICLVGLVLSGISVGNSGSRIRI